MVHRIAGYITFRRILVKINAMGNARIGTVRTGRTGDAIVHDITRHPARNMAAGRIRASVPGIDPAAVILYIAESVDIVIGNRIAVALERDAGIARIRDGIMRDRIVVAIEPDSDIRIGRIAHARERRRILDLAVLDSIIISRVDRDRVVVGIVEIHIVDVQVIGIGRIDAVKTGVIDVTVRDGNIVTAVEGHCRLVGALEGDAIDMYIGNPVRFDQRIDHAALD